MRAPLIKYALPLSAMPSRAVIDDPVVVSDRELMRLEAYAHRIEKEFNDTLLSMPRLTHRDYLAALFMQGVVANGDVCNPTWAYLKADEMIAEGKREKK